MFPQLLGLFDQNTCPLYGPLGFWRRIAFDAPDRVYNCNLKFDLLATQHGSAG